MKKPSYEGGAAGLIFFVWMLACILLVIAAGVVWHYYILR